MNTLSIDIGNSGIKVDSWTDDGLLWRELEGEVSVDDIMEEVESLNIKGIIVSTVRKDSEGFISELKERFNDTLVEFTDEEIRKHYDLTAYHGKIGTDRYAAYLGAKMFVGESPVMVVDIGTAMTIDVGDDKGIFRGGNISLGFRGRLEGLAKSADNLPLVEDSESRTSFGYDTTTAILSGAINGICGEIEYSAKLAKEEFGIKTIIYTGGGKRFVSPCIDKNIYAFTDKYLVGRGLDYHLRTHHLHVRVGYPQL
ncbi:MAG: type III pantothenate kinase [Muribaculaceae bacterium]|nr:type III pantothenate kinase [Muribaculaceae bacterium]